MPVTTHGSTLAPYQAKFFAHELERSHASDHVGKLAGLLFDAQVEPKPHQIDAALFALDTPFQKGVILADEVGLGKTIEAGIVISQYWSRRKRHILIIAPASLRQQWKQELWEKFLVPAELLDSTTASRLLDTPSDTEGYTPAVLICSYEFAARNEIRLRRKWDLVIADEAHRLRNYWKGGKTPTAVANIVEGAGKVLMLTATPLQNRLEELYGLVSVFDPEYFHSLEAFRERYVRRNHIDLPERVAPIAKRTLRRNAEKYVRFTQRMPITVEFEPSDAELRLDELIDEYLKRDEIFAFNPSEMHLSAMILRKRLGSSTYAIASTLEGIATRLEEELAAGLRRDGSLYALSGTDSPDAEDLTSDERERLEAEERGNDRFNVVDPEVRAKVEAEIRDLRNFAALARSITVNQKAIHLNDALERGFATLREIGAPEKAIIFTDSTVTQQYLARHLKETGWGEGIVLFNGTNNSPEATAIYKEWLAKNEGGDAVTGIAAADRRKALVDYFRDSGRIMIATEAAAEGVNLQFCSMLINYDLPWNPQRVEQRIGRVHRFGQKYNVVVANFSNKGNTAERRILELLTEKFKLFTSVFGASDEVLGSIEDGVDFEREIARILAQCRTEEEINAAFDELEARFSAEISTEMKKVRTKVFDNLDPQVQDRLRSYDEQSEVVLNQFERLFLDLTQYELDRFATFPPGTNGFILNDAPTPEIPTGRYTFKEQLPGAHQLRYGGPLGRYVIEQALSEDTPTRELTFSLSQSHRVGGIAEELAGQHGQLIVREVTFTMRAGGDTITESYLVCAGLTSRRRKLNAEDVRNLMDLTVTSIQPCEPVDTAALENDLTKQAAAHHKEVQARNAKFYDEQEDAVERQREDRAAEFDAQIASIESEMKELRKRARSADDPTESLRLKKRSRDLQQKLYDLQDEFAAQRRRLLDESTDYLDAIEDALQGTENTEELFAIRWRVEA